MLRTLWKATEFVLVMLVTDALHTGKSDYLQTVSPFFFTKSPADWVKQRGAKKYYVILLFLMNRFCSSQVMTNPNVLGIYFYYVYKRADQLLTNHNFS